MRQNIQGSGGFTAGLSEVMGDFCGLQDLPLQWERILFEVYVEGNIATIGKEAATLSGKPGLRSLEVSPLSQVEVGTVRMREFY